MSRADRRMDRATLQQVNLRSYTVKFHLIVVHWGKPTIELYQLGGQFRREIFFDVQGA